MTAGQVGGLNDIVLPRTPATVAAEEVARRSYRPALLHHCYRTYLFAASDAQLAGAEVDHELLFVAALLHDLGLTAAFDAADEPFEVASAEVAWVFAAGCGWSPGRRQRLHDAIVGHMRGPVAPATAPERYYLKRGTGLDIVGRGWREWPEGLLVEILTAHPRLDLPASFSACFQDQARRKPGSAAASALTSGMAERLSDHPFSRLQPVPA